MHERPEVVGRQRRNKWHQAAGQVLLELRDCDIHQLLSKLKSATVFLPPVDQRAQSLQTNNATLENSQPLRWADALLALMESHCAMRA